MIAYDCRRSPTSVAARTVAAPAAVVTRAVRALAVRLFTSATSATSAAVFVSLTSASSLAWADGVPVNSATPAQTKQATEHFVAGKQARDSKNWEQAISELRASLDVVSSPNARLELARSLRDSGALDQAWTEYDRVIDDATGLVSTLPRYRQTVDAATSERNALRSKIALVAVTVLHAPPDAALKVGGRLVPHERWTAPIATSPGAVDVVLTDAGGKELARQTVAAGVGQQASATVDAQPPPPTTPPPPDADDQPDFSTQPPPPSPASGRPALRPYAYVAGGVGVAGLAAFAVFGILSNNDFNDLKANCPGGKCPSGKAGEISDGSTFQTIANVGLGVGIVGVAAGATLFILSLTGTHDTTTGLVVGPGYLGLRGTL